MFTILKDGRKVEVIRTHDNVVSCLITEKGESKPCSQVDYASWDAALNNTSEWFSISDTDWTEYNMD